MSVANVRCVAKPIHPNASREERDRNFKGLFTAFKREVAKAGVLKQYKRHEFYESDGQKCRRKKREQQIAHLKAKMRESFPETKHRKVRDVE